MSTRSRRRHNLNRNLSADTRVRRTPGRARNAQVSPSGAGGSGDRGLGYQQTQGRWRNRFHLERELVTLYEENWAARKIVDIVAEDMLREGWEYKGPSVEHIQLLESEEDRLGVTNKLLMALKQERLLGGSVILMGVQDGIDDPREPVNFNNAREDWLRYLNVIPRSRVSRGNFDNDPLSPGYGAPLIWNVNGVPVHHSRLLIFDGSPLTPLGGSDLVRAIGFNQLHRNDGFGNSVLRALMDDLTYATGTRQAAFQLVNIASILLLKTDVQTLEETEQGQARLEELEKIAQQMSLYRAALMDSGMDGKAADVRTVTPSFGSVPDLVLTFLQVLSAASDIPATRFIGQAPGGLNATGESDLENYYNSISAKQRNRLRPQLYKLLPILGPSVLGAEFDIRALQIEFPKLWNLSELDESTVRANDATALVNMATAGIISSPEAEAEARQRGILITDPLEGMEEELEEPTPAPGLDDALNQLRAV